MTENFDHMSKTELIREVEKLTRRVDELEGDGSKGSIAGEALRQYERIISSTNDHMSFVGRDYIYRAVNDAYLRSFDKQREEIVGHSVEELLGEELFEKVARQNLDRCLSGEEVRFQAWVDYPTLGRRYMDMAMYQYVGEKGTIEGVVACGRDVTELKQAEDEIKKFKTISDKANYGTAIADFEGNLVYLNDAFANMHGYAPEEILGKHLSIFHSDEQMPRIKKLLDIIKKEGGFSGEEVWHKRRDGVDFPTLMSSTLIDDGKGAPLLMSLTAIDITNRKKAEEALLEEHHLNQILLDSMPCVALLIRPGTHEIVASNEAAVKAGAVPGKTCHGTWGESETPCPWCLAPEVWEKGEPQHLMIEGIGRVWDAHWFPISEDLYLHYAFDITEKKKVDDELAKADKLESVGILAGGLAHDFNNILTALWGNITLARMTLKGNKEIDEVLAESEEACKRAKGLTQQLLTFAKGGEPIKEPVNIRKLLDSSANFALRGSNVRADVDVPSALWTVNADGGQISQVINNLIINADQAMPEGGIIRVSAEQISLKGKKKSGISLEDGKYIKISIEDQGVGMSKEQLTKIFDPYYTTKNQGSGLGLSVCYSIISSHRGTIQVKSEIEKGSCFEIYLPAIDEKMELSGLEEAGLKIGTGKILVMDDEVQLTTMATRMLKLLGYEVGISKNGEEAIDKYKKALESGEPYDVVILDLTVPGAMGGKEAVKGLLEVDPNVKAIVSSGYSNDPIMAGYREYGFLGVMAKPYSIEDLGEKLKDVIGKKSP